MNDRESVGSGGFFGEVSGHGASIARGNLVCMKRFTLALGVGTAAVLATGLSGCTSAAPEPEPETLTLSEAGTRYLDVVCPVNAAWDAVDLEIDRLQIGITRGEDDTRLYAEALGKLADASSAAAKELQSADMVWPEAAAPLIDNVSASLSADAKAVPAARKLTATAIISYEWPGATESGKIAAEARAALDLPEDASAACAARAEQIAEERAAAQTKKEAAQEEESDSQAPEPRGESAETGSSSRKA